MKLRDTLLIFGAIGCFLLWILEFRRSSFADSYWLLLASLSLLFTFQYVRIKRREADKTLSPTVKQMVEDRQKNQGVRSAGAAQPSGVSTGPVQPTDSGKKKPNKPSST